MALRKRRRVGATMLGFDERWRLLLALALLLGGSRFDDAAALLQLTPQHHAGLAPLAFGGSLFRMPSTNNGRVTKLGMGTFRKGDPVTTLSLDADEDDDMAAKGKLALLEQKINSAWNFAQTRTVITNLIVFIMGYRTGVRQVLRSTIKTVEATPTQKLVTTKVRQWPVVSFLLLAFATREVWRSTPDWVKRNLPRYGRRFRASQASLTDDEVDPNDLTSFVSIAAKFKRMSELAAQKVAVKDLQSGFLALLRLVGQLKARYPERRDARYAMSGLEIAQQDLREALYELDIEYDFADWAYNELPEEFLTLSDALRSQNYTLLRHDETSLPGHVAHYVAISKQRRTALIGVKGTSSLEDLLTDCCGNIAQYELEGPYTVEMKATTMHCHEGVLLAAQRLADKLDLLISELLVPNGYKILMTGHSLGAGVAAVVGIILRSRYRVLWSKSVLEIKAFASPPVLEHDHAVACSSFCTTIVNNADIIPRVSLSNVVVLMEFIKNLNARMEAKGFQPSNSLKATAEFIRLLTSNNNFDSKSEMMLSIDEVARGIDDAFQKVPLVDPHHLYVPGRVLHMYDLWAKDDYKASEEATGNEMRKTSASHSTEGVVETPNADLAGGNSEEDFVRTAERVMVSNGVSDVLRMIEMDGRMISDHLSASYRSSIRSLLMQAEKAEPYISEVTVDAANGSS